MKVKDCMCNSVYCVTPNTNIQEVAKIMSENHIGCVPICNDDNYVSGIITDRDILLRCIACNKDTNQTKASDIMTTNVCTCMEEDDIKNAQTKMEQNQIRRLPVCDNKNKVIGILTLGDLAQNGEELGSKELSTTFENICDCNGQTKNAE